MTNPSIITCEERNNGNFACVYTAAEAAKKIGVAESTIRRMAKAAGVKRIAGRTVAGFLRIPASPVHLVLPVSEI